MVLALYLGSVRREESGVQGLRDPVWGTSLTRTINGVLEGNTIVSTFYLINQLSEAVYNSATDVVKG